MLQKINLSELAKSFTIIHGHVVLSNDSLWLAPENIQTLPMEGFIYFSVILSPIPLEMTVLVHTLL